MKTAPPKEHKKLTMISYRYAGKTYTHFVFAPVHEGKTIICGEVRQRLIIADGLLHKRLDFGS